MGDVVVVWAAGDTRSCDHKKNVYKLTDHLTLSLLPQVPQLLSLSWRMYIYIN